MKPVDALRCQTRSKILSWSVVRAGSVRGVPGNNGRACTGEQPLPLAKVVRGGPKRASRPARCRRRGLNSHEM